MSSIEQSPFFKLPLELRLIIYEDVLLSNKATTDDETQSRINIASKAAKPPPLTQTCRGTRLESTPVFLKNNFTVVITNLNASACDAWFAFFQPRRDTSKVNLEVQWSCTTRDLSFKRNFLPLLNAAFHDRSNVMPESSFRPWAISTPHRRSSFPKSQVVKVVLLGVDYARYGVERKLVTDLRYLTDAMLRSRGRGGDWKSICDDVMSNAWRIKLGEFTWLCEDEPLPTQFVPIAAPLEANGLSA